MIITDLSAVDSSYIKFYFEYSSSCLLAVVGYCCAIVQKRLRILAVSSPNS